MFPHLNTTPTDELLQQAIDTKNSLAETLGTRLKNAEDLRESRIEELEEEISDLEGEISGLEGEISELKEHIRKLETKES